MRIWPAPSNFHKIFHQILISSFSSLGPRKWLLGFAHLRKDSVLRKFGFYQLFLRRQLSSGWKTRTHKQEKILWFIQYVLLFQWSRWFSMLFYVLTGCQTQNSCISSRGYFQYLSTYTILTPKVDTDILKIIIPGERRITRSPFAMTPGGSLDIFLPRGGR